MPIAFDTFNEIWLICLFHDRFDFSINPKKLNCVTRSMLLPLICSSRYITNFLEAWKTINLVFATFSDNLLAPNID